MSNWAEKQGIADALDTSWRTSNVGWLMAEPSFEFFCEVVPPGCVVHCSTKTAVEIIEFSVDWDWFLGSHLC
jgi:hypothetical protein